MQVFTASARRQAVGGEWPIMAEIPSARATRAERAICALLTEQSIEDAAVKAGVGSRTIHRWLREDAAFQAAYNRAKREVVRQAQTRLQQATGKAVAALIAVIDDPLVQASARVSAAKAILEYAIRATLLLDSRVLCSTMVREAHLRIEGH